MSVSSLVAGRGGATLEWVVTVAGLPVRYYSGPVPPPPLVVPGWAHGGAPAQLYEDISAVVAVGDVSERIQPSRGWYEASPVSVTLATTHLARTELDPGRVFSALGPRSADVWAQVISSVTPASATLELDRDWPAGALPAVVHLGRESLRVSATGAPDVLTIDARAVGGSWHQSQYTDARLGLFPELTDRVVHWLGRPVSIAYAARLPGAPQLCEPEPWWEGVLSVSPTVQGGRVTLSVSPLTALLDGQIGGGLTRPGAVRLLEGVRRFWASGPRAWAWGEAVFRATPYALDATTTPPTVVFGPGEEDRWRKIWRPDLLAALGAEVPPTTHPAWGHGRYLYQPPQAGSLDVLVTDQPSGALTLDPVPIGDGLLDTDSAAQVVVVDLLRGVSTRDLTWPRGVCSEIRTAVEDRDWRWWDVWPDATRGSVSVRAAFGTAAASRPDLPSVRAARVLAGRVVVPTTGERLPRYLATATRGAWGEALRWRDGDPRVWVTHPTPPAPPPPTGEAWYSGPDSGPPSLYRTVSYPWRLSEQGLVRVSRVGDLSVAARWVGVDVTHPPADLPLELPRAYYETGEPSILLEGPIGLPAGGGDVLIEWVDAGGPSRATVRATGESPVVVAGVSGYLLDLASPAATPSCGSWRDGDCTVTATSGVRGVTSGEALLQLVTSATGAGVLGAYDTLPWGLGIPSYLVDEDSFLSPAEEVGQGWTLALGAATDVGAVITSLLAATGTQLALRRGVGGCRLARVPVGLPGAWDSAGELDDAALLDLPASGLDDEIVTHYALQVDESESEEPRDVAVVDQRAVATHGQGQTLSLDLRGLALGDLSPSAVVTALTPALSRLAYLYGSPRRTWRLAVPLHRALELHPGAPVVVSSTHLYSYGPTPGVVAAVGRVESLTLSPSTGAATLELSHWGDLAAGVHAASRVVAAAGPVLEVAAEFYSGGQDGQGGAWTDVDDWVVGGPLWLHPPGDPDGGEVVTVDAVAPGAPGEYTVTLAAHPAGAVSGGWELEARPYDLATAPQRRLAHLADGAPPTLGALGDGPKIYT